MAIIAANIIIGGKTISKVDIVDPIPVEGSLKSLREKATPQTENIEPIGPRRTRKSDKLIQYKESAFLSDMLSSSKD